MSKTTVNICWLRRDLRLDDNAALYRALKAGKPVLLLFIFDKTILDQLGNKTDPRVTFIYKTLQELHQQLQGHGAALLVKYGTPATIWKDLTAEYNIAEVYTNVDYEPYATARDNEIRSLLNGKGIGFFTYKDHVIFQKNEILKADGKPYTVFTPYFKQWQIKLNDFYLKSYPSAQLLDGLYQYKGEEFPGLDSIGFETSSLPFPSDDFQPKLGDYEKLRDFPAANATTRIGLHLRFGTVSIRKAARTAIAAKADKWLSELAWRDFYMMIIWHFPHAASNAFKPAYDQIKWRNNEAEFEAWCSGLTGYPIVDAGMRQLNATGWMHNRVRMVVASFLSKHLLIDWRWGEAYFAEKLLDYDLASNVGGWQWASGSGNDAAPYFRIFSPDAQTKRFDPKLAYIKKWIPEFGTEKYPHPIVEHAFARERVLKVYKEALNG